MMQTRRILRSRNDRIIAGVAGGIAAYLGVDPLYVRLGLVLLGFLQGLGILVYFVLWLLIPNEDSSMIDAREQVRENVGEMQATAERFADRVRQMFNQQNQGPLN
jgi:phage shock protein C